MSTYGAEFQLSTMTAQDGVKITTDGRDDAGFSVSDAGDVNGDGVSDIIIGAPAWSDLSDLPRGAYVIFGSQNGLPGTISLTDLDGTNGFRINVAAAGDLGGVSVSAAGDVNDDGIGDLILGAYGNDPNGNPRARPTLSSEVSADSRRTWTSQA